MSTARRLRARLAQRPDSEFEQALLRLALGSALVVYMLWNFESVADRGLEHVFVGCVGVFYTVATWIVVRICLTTEISPARRIIGAIADAAAITASMYFGGESAAAFIFVYVWVTLGNGFRYGPHYLLISLGLSAAGFAFTLSTNPFWSAHPVFGWEMLLGMVGICLYARVLVVKLNRATQRAEAANEAKRAFVSRMSHEMRTPLTSILGLADLLSGTRLAPDQRHMAGLVRESSLHLKSLVDDILDFSKIEAGKMAVERLPLDVRVLVWTVAGIVSPQARAKGLKLELRLAPDVPARIVSDEVRLRQILLNLASNAVKFTNTGSITLEVGVAGRTSSEISLHFAVHDTGIGIPAEKLGHIFDSFSQADEGVTRRFGGTGLGTTIARQLVELLGGRIDVQSKPGQGSTFRFEIPVEPAAADTPASGAQASAPAWAVVGFAQAEMDELRGILESWGMRLVAATAEPDEAIAGVFVRHDDPATASAVLCALRADARYAGVPTILVTAARGLIENVPPEAAAALALPLQRFDVFSAVHPLTAPPARAGAPLAVPAQPDHPLPVALDVLVIDDTATNRFVIRSILERFGHRCEDTATADEGLDRFSQRRFDVVVCDRNMPGMDGIELIRQIRALDRAGADDTALVMLTGDATADARTEALQAGVDAFLTKPVRPAELIEALVRVTAGRKSPTRGWSHPADARVPAEASPPLLSEETIAELAQLRPDEPEFVPRLQERFLSDARMLHARVVDALAHGDIGPVRDALHTIEGDAGSLGMEAIAQLCRMHRSLRLADIDGSARLFATRLGAAIAETANELARRHRPADASMDEGSRADPARRES